MLQSFSRQTNPSSISTRKPGLDQAGRAFDPGGKVGGTGGVLNAKTGPDAVLESLISETHHASARAVIVASWANALEKPEIAVNAKTVRALVPGQPAIMVTMRRWIETTTLNAETLHRTDEFFASLAVARQAFDLFIGEADQIGFVRAGILHRNVLSGSWRYASERAQDALNAQSDETALRLARIYSENGLALNLLIDAVKAGGAPCLNGDGTIRLPDLPNQRRSSRLMLAENCLVEANKRTFSAFARDVSEGGLGLDRVPQMHIGKAVTITLPTGRTFSGRVAWYKNAAAGIKFDTPLAPNDPLLRF